jgi:hypothetical protein
MPNEVINSESEVPKSGYSENVDTNMKLAQANTNLSNATAAAANKAAAVEQAQQQSLANQMGLNASKDNVNKSETVNTAKATDTTSKPQQVPITKNITGDPRYSDVNNLKPTFSEKNNINNLLPNNTYNVSELASPKEKVSFSKDELNSTFSSDVLNDFYKNAIPKGKTEQGMDLYLIKKLSEGLIDPGNIISNRFKKSDEFVLGANIPNPNAHIAAVLDYSNRFDIDKNKTLDIFNKMAENSRSGDPDAGIEYFLATGETNNNPTAEKAATLLGQLAIAVNDKKISEEEAGDLFKEGLKDLLEYGELKSILNNPIYSDYGWDLAGQAIGLAAGKAVSPIVNKIAGHLYGRLANAKGKVPSWLKQKLGVAADEEIKKLYAQQELDTKKALYEKVNGKIPEFKGKGPYSKWDIEAKNKFIKNFLDEAEKAAVKPGKPNDDLIKPFLDIEISDDLKKIMPSLEDLNVVDQASEMIRHRFPNATEDDITAIIEDFITKSPNSKWGKAFKKYRDFTKSVMDKEPDKFAAKYLERVAQESVTEGPEARRNAIDNAEYLLRHKDAPKIIGDIIYKSLHKRPEGEESKGFFERAKDKIKGFFTKKATEPLTKGQNIITNTIIGGYSAGKAGADVIKKATESEAPSVPAPNNTVVKPEEVYTSPNFNTVNSKYMTPSVPKYGYNDADNAEVRPYLDQYNSIKDAIQAKIDAGEPITQEEEEQLRDAWEALQNKHREIDQRVDSRIPELMNSLKKYLPNEEVSKELGGLSRSIIGAYKNGEFGKVGSAAAIDTKNRLIIDELASAFYRIADSTPGAPGGERHRSTWDKIQEERSKKYYGSYNKILEDAISKRSNLVYNILEGDVNARFALNKAMNDATSKRYFNKLDATQKARMLETLAMYGTLFNKLSQSEKSAFLDIMLTNDPNLMNEYNMLVKTFGSKAVSEISMLAKKAALEGSFWQNSQAREMVNQVKATIEKLKKETNITDKELQFYEAMAYSKIAQNYAKSGKEVLSFLKSLAPGGDSE